jgi:hypothetical protein
MFVTVIKNTNLALAFLLELAMLAAFGYWGFQTGDGTLTKIVLGIGVPIIVIILWGLFEAPRAYRPLPQPWHFILKVILFGGAVVALFAAGRSDLGWIFAGLLIVNAILLRIFSE